MRELLIATRNPAKIAEIAAWLDTAGIPHKTLRDFPNATEVEETGGTFEENATLKAKAYFAMTGLPALADDGGFEIDELGGFPGVKSRRFVHGTTEATDEEIVAHTLRLLRDVPDERRIARLRAVLCCYNGSEYVCAEAAVEGRVPRKAAPFSPGFPYRGLLFIPQFGKMYGALSENEHGALNHRRKALQKLLPDLRRLLA